MFDKKTKVVYVDRSFNFCNYMRIKKSNMFFRMISIELEKSVEFPIKCPFKKVKEIK